GKVGRPGPGTAPPEQPAHNTREAPITGRAIHRARRTMSTVGPSRHPGEAARRTVHDERAARRMLCDERPVRIGYQAPPESFSRSAASCSSLASEPPDSAGAPPCDE